MTTNSREPSDHSDTGWVNMGRHCRSGPTTGRRTPGKLRHLRRTTPCDHDF